MSDVRRKSTASSNTLRRGKVALCLFSDAFQSFVFTSKVPTIGGELLRPINPLNFSHFSSALPRRDRGPSARELLRRATSAAQPRM